MKTKVFSICFRWRSATNELMDGWERVETTSKEKAVVYGKAIAAERAPSYGGKYWFNCCELYPELQPA